MEYKYTSSNTIWISVLLAFFSLYMFSDTLRGGVDMASAGVRFLYSKYGNNFGLSTFNEEELTEQEKSRNIKNFRDAHVGGLFNEGNTCFINSVIQALASCEPLTDYLAEFEDAGNFSGGLNQIITYLNQIHTKNHGYSTLKLMRQVGQNNRWNRFDQEDAQEFFQMLLNTLEKDRKELDKEQEQTHELDEKQKSQSEQDQQIESESTNEKNEDSNDKHKLITPFDGCFAVRVGCMKCNDMEGIRTGVLSSVDLNLGEGDSSFSLDDLLKTYCAMETISGVECYRCSLLAYRHKLSDQSSAASNDILKSAFTKRIVEVDDVLNKKVIDEVKYKQLKFDGYRVQSDKTKQTMFCKPTPDVLMIHINRSFYDFRTGMARKNFSPVNFPMELDLAPFTVDVNDESNNDASKSMKGSENEHMMYRLRAAVIHYGSANYGHYITFRKYHGFWWRISDDQVTLTTEAQVRNVANVFMLFYEKISSCTEQEKELSEEFVVNDRSPDFSDEEGRFKDESEGEDDEENKDSYHTSASLDDDMETESVHLETSELLSHKDDNDSWGSQPRY